MKLYELTTDVQNFYDNLDNAVDENGELKEEYVNMLVCKEEEFDKKALQVATAIRLSENDLEIIDSEIERLQTIKKARKNALEHIKSYLSINCQALNKLKIDGVSAKISFRKSESVVEDDFDKVPEKFIKIEIKKSLDKTAIKNAIKNGEIVDGVHLETKNNIQIK